MKKLIPFLLVLALIGGMLTACDGTAAVLAKADKALEDAPYTVTMSMNFTSDNKEMNELFELMNVEVPVTIDGNNMAMDMSMDVMGSKVGMKMTVVDKVLYYNMDLMGQAMKMKCTLTEEQYNEFLSENNAELPVDAESFEKLSMETVDGKQVINCSGLLEQYVDEMNKMIADAVAALGSVDCTVGDVGLIITVKDGKYESMKLSATYTITVDSESVSVTMNMNAAFSYDGVAAVTAPADADSYVETNYSEIFG